MTVEKIHISEHLSSKIILRALDENPDLKLITCPVSLYNRAPKQYIAVLEELGVKVKPVIRKGRPKKFSKDEIKTVDEMFKKDFTAKEISDKLEIDLKAVYYIRSRYLSDNVPKLKRGKKSKYSSEIRSKVKELYSNKIPVKEISKKENIPLRSVYNILNDK